MFAIFDKIYCIHDIYYLKQSDFNDGTYRITQTGTYIIEEDIIFEFNSPSTSDFDNLDTYNNNNDWWPTSDQTNMYPGAGNLRNSYSMGFFAGITIETSNVILDLDGYELKMSKLFYYQQAFFALICLTSQPFLPTQGINFLEIIQILEKIY